MARNIFHKAGILLFLSKMIKEFGEIWQGGERFEMEVLEEVD